MEREFDGQTEKEAVQNAIDTLHIKDFEYKIVSSSKKSIFKKPMIRISVIYDENKVHNVAKQVSAGSEEEDDEVDEVDEVITPSPNGEAENEVEEKVIEFLSGLCQKMGFSAKPYITARGSLGKIFINLETCDSAIIIGYRGKMLDAIQVIVSAYCLNISDNKDIKIVLDIDDYRERHEDKIIKNAVFAAKKVKSSGRPVLLEPLNSYERRLVHKAISKIGGVASESQGNGLVKKIKIFRI